MSEEETIHICMLNMIRCQKFDYFPHFSKNKRLTDTVGNI